MALLDLQNLDTDEGNHPAVAGSSLSLIGCISSVSFLVCL
ncbi:SapB/AmfS family lanthipeptide [Streptomyces sp. V4-01]|uniref:SapB/AmfS family lanthipeptide n=1 Tax=Actinacidiphila polyblastidii TaxID=3110430 RepID=A0ABU7PF70_9ACTN|nr:SapB/AmfS family lanthipeptide [Streptomyces sp. V4-01]